MATKKSKNTNDARKAAGRFVDQPGQWKNVSPASVNKRCSKKLAALAKEMEKAKKKK